MTVSASQIKNCRIEKAFAIAVIAIAVALGFFRLRFGLDIWDEGIYYNAPFRYAHGDIPIKNEWVSVGRWADIVVWPVMKMLPDGGSILILRSLWFAFHVFCVGALFNGMRRYLSLPVLAACFAASLHVNPFSLWSPSYYTLPTDFVCLSMACLLAASRAPGAGRAIISGTLGGISFFLCVVCYFPTFVLLGIIAAWALYLLIRNGGKSAMFIGAASLFAVSSILLLCFIGIIARAGLVPELRNVYEIMTSSPIYSGGISRIFKAIYQFKDYLPAALALLYLFWSLNFCASRFCSKTASAASKYSALAAAGAGVALLLAISFPKMLGGWMITASFIYIYYRFFRSDIEPSAFEALDPIFVVTLAWYGLIGIASAGKLFSSGYAALPMFVVLAVIAERAIDSRNSAAPEDQEQTRWRKRALVFLFLLLSLNTIVKTFSHTFVMETPFYKSTKKATYGRMAGIYGAPDRITHLEELLRYLEPRVKDGDRLLSFNYFAMLPYLAGALPAMDTCFVDNEWPASARRLLLERMIADRHVPAYAVRRLTLTRYLSDGEKSVKLPYSEDPITDPIFAFVSRNYKLEKTIGPFEVWKLNLDYK